MSLNELTPELVDLISAFLSFFAVLVAAIAAPIVFWLITRKSVADFSGAIEKVTDSASSVDQKVEKISFSFDRLQERLALFDEQVTAQLSSLQVNQGRTQGRIDDEAAIAELEQPKPDAPRSDPTARESLVEAWNQIRDLLEAVAADPAIDGRTRAKYARVDRRNYNHLASALARDGELPGRFETWEEAISLWYESRKHLNTGLGERPSRMQLLRDELLTASNGSRVNFELSLPEEIRRRACSGEFGPELTADVLLKYFPDYSEPYLRQILPNFCEGGFKAKDGTRACFRRVGHGRYVPICDYK